ncbi:MAG: polysaccharide biosynthesis tyrosine autokinase [Terrimicrobiaceae bacterium]|nr:polysaccharide biosynthesis tyrosine autokinase [Terrimicrobiaceae bacterium]
MKKFEENLRASEEKLNAYTRTLGNVSIDNDLNIVANQLRELTSRATVAKAERIRLENEYAQVQMRLGDPARLLEIESIQRMPAISNLSVQIAEVKAKIAKLELRYREANPFMKQARSELAELEEALRKAVLDAPKTIESALANARRAEESIIREQKLQEEKVIQVRDLAVPSRVLQRQIDADRQALEAALKRLTEELSQARSQPVLLQVVNWAGYGVPEPSSKVKTLAMTCFLGLMAGAGVIFLITQLDTTFKAGESAARILGLPLLGEIPACPAGPEAGHLPLACPALDDIHSPAAEAFRSLRAALWGPDEQPGPVLVCSAEPEAGSSFCAANLAVVFAQAGQRTLLVEANLREPVLASALLERPAHAGLTEFLLREAGFANVINPTRQSLLDLVTAGAPSALPSEILSRERFGALLREAAPLYDRIVVDSAAVTTYSDTLGFARLLPVICFVAAAGKTERDPARRAVEQLRQAGARPTGLIFNHNSSRRKKTRAEEAGPAAPAGRARPRPVPGPLDGSAPPGLQREPLPPGQARGGAPSAARASLPPGLATAPGVEKRDVSPAGRQRRLVFGELLSALQSAGMSPEQARQYLLLNLKIWSNEAPDDTDASQAAIERARLLSDLIERLIQSGIPRAEARARITQALDAWRAHPG